jgi:hypothetical protein
MVPRPPALNLGDDVRRDLVFDEGDAIAQLQLALLQPLQPQQIRCWRLMQGIDRGVEITVLLLQPCELGFEFALVLIAHGLWLTEKRDELPQDCGNFRKEYCACRGRSASFQAVLWGGNSVQDTSRFRTHNPLHVTPKYDARLFDNHRQIRWLV